MPKFALALLLARLPNVVPTQVQGKCASNARSHASRVDDLGMPFLSHLVL